MTLVKSTTFTLSLLAAELVLGCGAAQTEPAEAEQPTATPENFEKGTAHLFAKSGSKVKGALAFRDSPDGLHVTGDLEGLDEGSSFAVSLHTSPDCSAHDGKSVGPIFNPSSAVPPVGLIGEVRGLSGGEGKEADFDVPHLRLNGSNSVLGLSVVVHAWPYDPNVALETVPFLACGVIEGRR